MPVGLAGTGRRQPAGAGTGRAVAVASGRPARGMTPPRPLRGLKASAEATVEDVEAGATGAGPRPPRGQSPPGEQRSGRGCGRLVDLSLRDFARQVGEPRPRAGGGSVAAYTGALAAALVDMVCRLTVAARDQAEPDGALQHTCRTAESLRARLLAAVDADTDAYRRVVEASRMATDGSDEEALRESALAAARLHAAAVPLQAAETCLEVLSLVEDLRDGFYAVAASELAVAVQATMTCVYSGAVDVEVNLKHLEDDAAVAELRRRTRDVVQRAGEVFAVTWPFVRDAAADVAG
jgi:formiminotetrahydrofolate cyclodeaminase